jgi:ElaB/YqjD/DUF883 family membrane-anchored ribosome-binding protein
MISLSKALEIVSRGIKQVAGKGQPNRLDSDHTLESLGILTTEQLKVVKTKIESDLASEGYEFRKMSLDSLQRSHTVAEAADLVRHAEPIEATRFY